MLYNIITIFGDEDKIDMNNNIFGTRLRQLRKNKGLTQSELAHKLGVSTSSVGMYEQGRREPDNGLLLKICNLLDTTPDYLVGVKTIDKSSLHQDVSDVIDEFTQMLMSQQGLMFNGTPMTAADREKIVIAIKSAAAVVIPPQDNK